MERINVERIHLAVVEAVDQGFWHRVPLSGDSTETNEAVAYLAMMPTEEGIEVWYVALMPTRLTPERLTQDLQRQVINPDHEYPFFWSLEDFEGNLVAMPSQKQIEEAAVRLAAAVAPGLPVGLFVSQRGLHTGARCMEFWHPHNTPTADLFKVLQRCAAAVYP